MLRSRSARPLPNERARASVIVGFVAFAVVPGAVGLAAYASWFELTEAAAAIPVGIVLGIVAIVLSRSARRRADISLGRIGGRKLARIGGILGALSVYIAATCLLAVAFFGILLLFG